MTETKPPNGYETWIEAALDWTSAARFLFDCKDADGVDRTDMQVRQYIAAELRQLRAKAAAYDEAMRRLKNLADGWGEVKWAEARANIAEFVREQIAANRFAP